MTRRVEVYARLEAGDIWGLRPDNLCLADGSLFDLRGTFVARVEDRSVDIGRRSTAIHAIRPYNHKLWQPEDFVR